MNVEDNFESRILKFDEAQRYYKDISTMLKILLKIYISISANVDKMK